MSESALLNILVPFLIVIGVILMIVPPILRARRSRHHGRRGRR